MTDHMSDPGLLHRTPIVVPHQTTTVDPGKEEKVYGPSPRFLFVTWVMLLLKVSMSCPAMMMQPVTLIFVIASHLD